MTRHSILRLSASISAVALAALAQGCASAPMHEGVNHEARVRNYAAEKTRLEKSKVVSPGFKLRIAHSADDQLSGEYHVDFRGMLKLPYHVTIQAAGLSTDALAEKIEKAYASYFKVKDRVSVEIASREFLVELRGLIQKPGVYTVKLDTNLEELIAMGGGLPGSGGADGKTGPGGQKPEYVRIVRPEFADGQAIAPTIHWVKLSDYFLRYDIRNEQLWRGGEQVFFQVAGDPEALKERQGQTIQVLGEVHKPGEYSLETGTDIYSFLAEAGGPTSTADLSSVVVVHKKDRDSTTYDVSSDDVYDLDLGPGDVIMVKSSQTRPGFFERMAPILVSVGTLAVAIMAVAL